MQNWFTADAHFNDFEMIGFAQRPYKTDAQMNADLIKRWNTRVNPGDTVYHIGDFRMHGGPTVEEITAQLNGHIVFIKGNHDNNNKLKTILEEAVVLTHGKRILLVHDPMDAWKRLEDYDIAFVGHVHKAWKYKKFVVNVGMDVWDRYPVHAKTILNGYEKWLKTEGAVCQ